jgi:hypothetical protein
MTVSSGSSPVRQPGRVAPASIMRGAVLLAALCCSALGASAQDAPARKALKVCQDPNNMPFSNTNG